MILRRYDSSSNPTTPTTGISRLCARILALRSSIIAIAALSSSASRSVESSPIPNRYSCSQVVSRERSRNERTCSHDAAAINSAPPRPACVVSAWTSSVMWITSNNFSRMNRCSALARLINGEAFETTITAWYAEGLNGLLPFLLQCNAGEPCVTKRIP